MSKIKIIIKIVKSIRIMIFFIGYWLSDIYISRIIDILRILIGENITNKQVDAFYNLFYYKTIFNIFIAVIFWMIFSVFELVLKDKTSR